MQVSTEAQAAARRRARRRRAAARSRPASGRCSTAAAAGTVEVPVYRRDRWPPGGAFAGPAIIAEDETSTYHLGEFCRAYRRRPAASSWTARTREDMTTMSQSNSVGLIDLQIMWNRLIAVVEEQAQTLLRTAFSPIVRECGDLSAGVFDLKGRMLAQAVTGTPGHVNSMAESVKHFIAPFPGSRPCSRATPTSPTIPWMGTGHLNDFVITTPCFQEGQAGRRCSPAPAI